VTYVADTHAFVWYLTGQRRRVGRAAYRVFRRVEAGRDQIRLSAISLFEVALLVERGRLRSPLSWGAWLAAARETAGFGVEPMGLEDVDLARDLAILVDPFDRLVVATARRIDAPLLTSDERIASSGLVEVVWA
jgi:PIN domain nuclease of toxin-antitoxin system